MIDLAGHDVVTRATNDEALDSGMKLALSGAQRDARDRARRFVQERIAPHAGRWDREERMPLEVIDDLRSRGYLGAPLPTEAGGGGMEPITYGLITQEIGKGCSSVRSLLTVHDMVGVALSRWGSRAVKEEVLPRLGRAEWIAALALSEPNAGSDAASVETEAREEGEELVLTGKKRWISFGQVADLFLVLARWGGELTAFLVPANAPGLSRQAISGIEGTRASLLADLHLNDCRIPRRYLVGRKGFGLSHVFSVALDHGRYSVAWGAVGIAQACLDACLEHTTRRVQFGVRLADHQLVQRTLTEMIVASRGARLLCYRAGYLRQIGDPGAVPETMIAKYFSSRAATRSANDAVQLHGAIGLSDRSPVGRYLRDARVTEVIEGSTQIQQISIPRYPLEEL